MYGLDNASGVNVMPKIAPVGSTTPLWFTEGGAGLAASYPGQDWFNMIQAELLNVLTAGGVKPEKGKLNQLAEAIGKIVGSGNYATKKELSDGLDKKFDKTNIVQGIGSSTTAVMSQDAATKSFLKSGDFGIGLVAGFEEAPIGSDDNPLSSACRRLILSPKSKNYQTNIFWTISGPLRMVGYTNSGSGVRGELVEFHSTANTTTDRNGYIRTVLATEQMQSVPIGGTLLWNTTASIPENFWPNEGRSFSASEYPELAKVFTNLRLPDDRGYGIRVADNGKGIDAGRTVGTYQEDAVQSVTGSVRNLAATSADYQYAGAFFGSDKGGIEYAVGSSGQRFRTLEFDIGRVARTANETRMKNVAKILITRVK